MQRYTFGTLATLLLAVSSQAAPDPKKDAEHDTAPKIAEKLLERVDISERIDKLPLGEVLDFLRDKLSLTILLDRPAFAVRDEEVEQRLITIPTMKKVRAETILRYVTDQIEAELFIAPDHLSITTASAKDLLTGKMKALPELYPAQSLQEDYDLDRTALIRATPFVTAEFKETPLADALKDIATRAGRNVIISQPAAEKTKSLISVRLSNVAFENAAATLAEAGGLRAFRSGNVVVIVTSERAKEVEKQSQFVGINPFGPNPFQNGGGGITMEQLESISKLLNHKSSDDDAKKNELEEKVKRLVEELEKLKKK